MNYSYGHRSTASSVRRLYEFYFISSYYQLKKIWIKIMTLPLTFANKASNIYYKWLRQGETIRRMKIKCNVNCIMCVRFECKIYIVTKCSVVPHKITLFLTVKLKVMPAGYLGPWDICFDSSNP